MTENWYIALDLEFDPNPVTDEETIQKKIDEKKNEWSRQVNDFKKGPEARKYLDYVKKGTINKEMIGPDNCREEMIKDACAKVYGEVDKTLKMIGKAEISEDIIKKIVTKKKFSEDVVRRRAAQLGMKITAEAASDDTKDTYEKYYKSKPKSTDVYNGLEDSLNSFNAKNLYEFLYPDNEQLSKKASNLPCASLLQRAKERKTKDFYKHDGISGTGSKLCGQCEQTFKDEASKRTYDEYLDYRKRVDVLNEIKEIYDLNDDISDENISNTLGKLTEIFKDRNQAQKVLEAFCKESKIPISLKSEKEKAAQNKIKVCRCGFTNDITDGRTKCAACGLDLQIKCPKCGTLNDNTIKICKCGFNFSDIDKAVALCDDAERAIGALDFSVAEANLADAERYWPGSEKVKETNSRLVEMKSRVGTAAEELHKAVDEKRFFEAQKVYDRIRQYFPEYHAGDMEEDIKTAISQAEEFKKIAETATDEAAIVDACTKAFEASSDCPGVREIVSKYPPESPTGIVVSADPDVCVNALSWNPSSTQGLIYYSVVRKEGSIPISNLDGTLIGRVSMNSINDNLIKPGVQYYYTVFAERAGIFSKGLSTDSPVANYFEIKKPLLTAGDQSIQLSWGPLSDSATIVIEREASGNKTTLKVPGRNSYVDNDLENDKEYKYHIFLTYANGLQKHSTKGIILKGIPTRPPKPIEKLVVKPQEGDDFSIEWENPENSNIRFFYSESRPDYLPGDLIAVSELEEKMTELMVNRTGACEGTFKHSGENLIYVIAAAEKSGSAVVGTIARASHGGTVKINDVTIVNSKIMIRTDLPKDCTGFVVLYRHDQFPEDISDTQTVRKYISLKQYQYDNGLLIDSCDKENYYFSIYAEFRRDGEKDYSTGTDYLFANQEKVQITYGIDVNKKLIGGSTIVLTFETEAKDVIMPVIDIMSQVGVAPMFKKSAKLLYSVPSQPLKGMVRVEIPMDKKTPRETYIKAFLQDENNADRFQLKLKLRSNLKIS